MKIMQFTNCAALNGLKRISQNNYSPIKVSQLTNGLSVFNARDTMPKLPFSSIRRQFNSSAILNQLHDRLQLRFSKDEFFNLVNHHSLVTILILFITNICGV